VPELVGRDVLYRRWAALPRTGHAKGAFLLVHGLGAQSARWGPLAEHLAGAGFASYAIELRGFGLTPERPRGHIPSLRVWEKDILTLRETVASENPGARLFLLGESVGGLLAFNAACRFPGAFDGLVLIAPYFKNALRFPLSSYLTLAAWAPFRPSKTISLAYTSAMITRDADLGAALDADPGELRVGSLACLISIQSEQGRAKRLAPRLLGPPLFLIPGEDRLADSRAGRRLFARLTLADKAILEYPGMFHALSIDLGREKVFRDIQDWAGRRL